jgi:hypothetical protein
MPNAADTGCSGFNVPKRHSINLPIRFLPGTLNKAGQKPMEKLISNSIGYYLFICVCQNNSSEKSGFIASTYETMKNNGEFSIVFAPFRSPP